MKGLYFIGLALSLVVSAQAQVLERTDSNGRLKVRAVADDVLQIQYIPNGSNDRPTEMMDPHGLRTARSVGTLSSKRLGTGKLMAELSGSALTVAQPGLNMSLSLDLDTLWKGLVRLKGSGDLYGMRGNILFGKQDPRTSPKVGLLRNEGALVKAGSQGDGGAPMAYTSKWGILIDSIDGLFTREGGVLEFSHNSRKSIEAYVFLGPPKDFISRVAQLTGLPAMPPKWSLGFLNSQWGTTEDVVTSFVSQYRKREIPLDGIILDFDFKAWGEDNFGEWRWNSTKGAGNVSPDKFPNGSNGLFGKRMLDQGIHISGIMKPRILTQNADRKPTIATAEVTAHKWWAPGKKPYQDYFSNRLADDLNFADPAVRKWYWKHSKGLFDTGISGWWNDEADDDFDSLGFFHMQQSLFEGQRSASNRRVWSLNRNFYLGAQRFGFGTWSGDINSGFQSMAEQRLRMLDLIDLGQTEWSMDTGGFNGHPSPENYARWMEFASVVPIMRVHGTYGEHRQPWIYGPVAEEAAKKAIELRYALFPYLYSNQHQATTSGIGIVRPLNWEFPDDPGCVNNAEEWMVGDGLLVAPIVEEGATQKNVYLPAGTWFNYVTGDRLQGGKNVELPTDSETWSDLPMFVRSGSIVATQPVQQYETQTPVKQITLDVWPDRDRIARFEVYDDDGETMEYEKGKFFSQLVKARMSRDVVQVEIGEPKGRYSTPIDSYRVRIHQSLRNGSWNGASVPLTYGSQVSEAIVPARKAGVLIVRPN